MIIIIFGCIGVGKSTLARLLVAQFNFRYIAADDVFRQRRTVFLTPELKKYYQKYTKIKLLKLIFKNEAFAELVRRKIWPPVTNRIVKQIKLPPVSDWVVEIVDLSLLKWFSGYCLWLVNTDPSVIHSRVKVRYPDVTLAEIKFIINAQRHLFNEQLTKYLNTSFCLVKIDTTNLSMEEVLMRVKSNILK